MEVVNRIKIVIEGMKRETDDLKMWFANHLRVRGKNRRFLFPTCVFGIEKFNVTISQNFAFFLDSDQNWVNRNGRRSHFWNKTMRQNH